MTSAPDAAPPRAYLAVVVVNYNAGEYLARCVTSVVEASGELALDMLIVDNASSDGSARAAAERSPLVRLIENPANRGLSAAWSQVARDARARGHACGRRLDRTLAPDLPDALAEHLPLLRQASG